MPPLPAILHLPPGGAERHIRVCLERAKKRKTGGPGRIWVVQAVVELGEGEAKQFGQRALSVAMMT